MTEEALDLIVSGTAPDEVTLAANALIQKLSSKYEPLIQKAEELVTQIPEDPVASGLADFNLRLARLRTSSNTVSQWLAMAVADKQRCRSRVKAAKSAFDTKLQHTLAMDDRVAAVSGQQSKMAVARNLLVRESRVVDYADQIYTLMSGYHDALKVHSDNLADTKRDLMAQLAVIKQMVNLGEVSGGEFNNRSVGGSPSMKELEAQVAAELGEAPGLKEI